MQTPSTFYNVQLRTQYRFALALHRHTSSQCTRQSMQRPFTQMKTLYIAASAATVETRLMQTIWSDRIQSHTTHASLPHVHYCLPARNLLSTLLRPKDRTEHTPCSPFTLTINAPTTTVPLPYSAHRCTLENRREFGRSAYRTISLDVLAYDRQGLRL